jgi:RNA polymerase sigma-70 factor (ECF subfamily)
MMVDATVDEDFARFFDEMFERTVGVARRITGSTSVAEDVAAETFTRAYVRWRQLSGDPRRIGWTIRVATNLAIDVGRRRQPETRSQHVAESATDELVVRIALTEALRHLSRREREVITLRYLADLTESEVAGALGVSPGSVKTYVRRGLAHLRSLLALGDDIEVEGRLAIDTE